MNLNSLSTKIRVVFIFTLALFLAVFIFYTQFEKHQIHAKAGSNHEKLTHYFMVNRLQKNEVIEYMKTLGFTPVRDPFIVFDYGEHVYSNRGLETIFYQDSYYLHAMAPHFRLLFKDATNYEKNYFTYLLFVLIFILIIMIYFWLIKSLKPLEDLKNKISKFAKGDFEIDCSSDKKDEIADVANEFDSAVKKISLLLKSRQLFLRTVMHELKTPIAKGRIVSELIDQEIQKKRMITIFEKL